MKNEFITITFRFDTYDEAREFMKKEDQDNILDYGVKNIMGDMVYWVLAKTQCTKR